MSFFIISYVGFGITYVLICRKMANTLAMFLNEYTDISGEIILIKYKSMIRKYMYLQFAYSIISIIIICLGIFLIIASFTDKSLFRGLFIGFLGIVLEKLTKGQEIDKLENKAKALDCANKDLKKRYHEIRHTWLNKTLPDF